MPLTVTARTEGNLAIVELQGSLTLGPSLSALRSKVREVLAADNIKGLILKVGLVSIVDSAGIGELTAAYALAARRGCPLRLVEVPAVLRHLLELTRLETLLPSVPDLAAAKKQLNGLSARNSG